MHRESGVCVGVECGNGDESKWGKNGLGLAVLRKFPWQER
jgi:hypothetical protein